MKPEAFHVAERGRPLGGPVRIWLSFRLVPFIAATLVKILSYTLRVRHEALGPVENLADAGDRFILAFYHRRLVLMPTAYPFRRFFEGERRGVAILSSDSKDGERSAATWRWFDIHAVRGTAGGHSGAQSLVKMIRIVKEGWDLGITVDGPRGPRQQVKAGVLAVSRKTGAWVVPVCVAYERAWKLGTWDEMLVPKPFSAVVVRYGEPFRVPRDADEEAFRERLEADLNQLELWAQAFPG